jgi:anti-sigma B factor antagonist
MDSPRHFQVSTEAADSGVRVVAVTGELDIATSERLEMALLEAASMGPPVIVDLSACTFIDSSGVRALLSGKRMAQARDGDTRIPYSVVAAASQLMRIFELTRFETVVPVHPSLEAAVQATGGG